MKDKQVTVRYTLLLEQTIADGQQAHETHEDFIERIADRLFYENGLAIEGRIIDLDNVEEM